MGNLNDPHDSTRCESFDEHASRFFFQFFFVFRSSLHTLSISPFHICRSPADEPGSAFYVPCIDHCGVYVLSSLFFGLA